MFALTTTNPPPIKSSSDFRRIVELAVRKRQDRLLESFRAILVGAQEKSGGDIDRAKFEDELFSAKQTARTATYYPDSTGGGKYHGYRSVSSFPERYDVQRLDLAMLRSVAQKVAIDFRGRPFLYYGCNQDDKPVAVQNGLEGAIKFTDFLNQDRAEFWHFGYSGLFYQRALMTEESYALKNSSLPVMDIREFAVYAAESLRCICSLYEDVFDSNERITVAIRVSGAKGRRLTNIDHQRMPLFATYESKMDVISYDKTRTLADWRSGLIDHALEICGFVFERFNWDSPNLNLFRQTIEDLFSRKLM